jgi:hypothetical protein
MSEEFSQESGWEDSYQKRERLFSKLSLTLKDLDHFMKIWETESVNMENQFHQEMIIHFKEVESLNKQEDYLGKEIKELEVDCKTEKNQDKEYELISKRFDIMDLWTKITDLYTKIDNGFQNHIATNGDIQGIAVIVESKLAHLKELRKEIAELG